MTSTAEIGNLRVRLGIDSAEFANGVRSVQGSLATLSSSLKTFATGAAAITLFNSAVTALKDVADLGDVAESIGLSAEQLQVFQKMALASGTSTDVLVRGLQSIAEQSTDANSKLSQLFTANGLTMAGKEMNQIILEFMTLLQNAKSPAEQLAIATGVLGDKVGRQLVESLRTGSAGWTEAYNTMVASGWYMSNEQVKAAQAIETEYNKVIANIKAAWAGLVVTITQGLMKGGGYAISPQLKAQFQQFADAADGVTTAPGKGDMYTGKGDLPSNVNSTAGYSVSSPTANPFNGISAPKASTTTPIVPAIPKDTIDSIYGTGEAFTSLWEDMAAGMPTTNELTQSFQQMADTIADSLSTALVGLISGTMSVQDAFESMLTSISQQLEQLAAQIIKSQIFNLLSMFAGNFGGVTVGGMSFGGFYADGGHLGSGQWGIAGENGPEIIHGPANITPMDGMGGGSPQMNVTVINNSAAQVATRQGANGGLDVIIEDKIAAAFARGGNKIDSAIQKGYGLRRAGR